jgi:heterodisulfide reductase subunit A
LPNPEVAPGRTGTAGVFVAGAAAGPKDIPDTILTAGAAASEAAAFLRSSGWRAREPEPAVATRFGAA